MQAEEEEEEAEKDFAATTSTSRMATWELFPGPGVLEAVRAKLRQDVVHLKNHGQEGSHRYVMQEMALMVLERDNVEYVVQEVKTEERAIEIQQTLLDNEKTEAVMVDLCNILNIPGLRKNLPAELINSFGSNAAEIVKKTPYILTSFTGISFILADRVSIDIGVNPMSLDRKKEAAKHVIRENMSNGNVWVEERDLIQETSSLIGVMGCEQGVFSLFEDGIITKKNGCVTSGKKFVLYALVDEAEKENKIAQKLAELMKNEPLLKTTSDKGGF